MDTITSCGHYECDIPIIWFFHVVHLVCPGYSFAPVEIYEDESICLLKYEESTQFQKMKLSSLYLTRLFFLIYRVQVGQKILSAFCAQHQFLLDFYIYFYICNMLSISCHVYYKLMLLFYLYFLLLFTHQTTIRSALCKDILLLNYTTVIMNCFLCLSDL